MLHRLERLKLVNGIMQILVEHEITEVEPRHINAIIDAAQRICDEFWRESADYGGCQVTNLEQFALLVLGEAESQLAAHKAKGMLAGSPTWPVSVCEDIIRTARRNKIRLKQGDSGTTVVDHGDG